MELIYKLLTKYYDEEKTNIISFNHNQHVIKY